MDLQQRLEALEKRVAILEGREGNKKFVPPTQDELIAYLQEKGITGYPAQNMTEKFLNHYTSNGWRVGKNKMQNWRAAINNWIQTNKDASNFKQGTSAARTNDLRQWNIGF